MTVSIPVAAVAEPTPRVAAGCRLPNSGAQALPSGVLPTGLDQDGEVDLSAVDGVVEQLVVELVDRLRPVGSDYGFGGDRAAGRLTDRSLRDASRRIPTQLAGAAAQL